MPEKEWPSSEKLQELRRSGTVHVNRVTTSALTIASLLLAIYLILPEFQEYFSSSYNTILRSHESAEVSSELTLVLTRLGTWLVILSAVTFAATFLFSLLQSRFYSSLAQLSFRFSRLWAGTDKQDSIIVRIIKIFLSEFALICIGAAFSFLAVVFFMPYSQSILANSALDLVSQNKAIFLKLLQILILLNLILGFSFWLVSRYMFMLKHRVHKEEVGKQE